MINPLVVIVQCGAFVLIPMGTFAFGLWLIARFISFQNRLATPLVVFLIGVIFFEASLIAMLIDLRASSSGLPEKIGIAGLFGVIVVVCILIVAPIYRAIMHMFK